MIYLDELYLPKHVLMMLTEKYMEYPPNNRETIGVIQRHEIGDSQHFDIRFKVNNHLVGWSVVGFSKDQPAELSKLVRGKGFRAETKCVSEYCDEWRYKIIGEDSKNKVVYVEYLSDDVEIVELARQPLVWLFPHWKIGERHKFEPKTVGAGIEKAGYMTVLARLKVKFGTQKPYFHEYFIKDGKNWKDWTRVVVRAIKVRKIDPKTKKPTDEYERMWRFMIAKNDMPYAISNRAMKEGWKPPQGIVPFPEEWAKEKFPKQYEKWVKYMKGELRELSKIKFSLAMTSWMGPRAKTGRRMPVINWYLLFDDKGKDMVRRFWIDGNLLYENVLSCFEEPRVSKKWMDYTGKTEPNTVFNENKELVGQYVTVDKGTCEYNTRIEDGREIIDIVFDGTKLKGKYQIVQEKGSDMYVISKLSGTLEEYKFVLDEHEFPEDTGKIHYDLRIQIGNRILEFNLYKNPLETKVEEPIRAVAKGCRDLEWMKIKEKGTRMKAFGVWSKVHTIDHGSVEIIEFTPSFMSFMINGKKLKGYYIARRVDGMWEFMESKLPKGEKELQSKGDPKTGDYYDPFIIEKKRTWDYFIVHIYDLRYFTRCEPKEKVKLYLPDLDIPKGVDVAICLYHIPNQIHRARVAYVKFSSDWSYDDAEKWIKDNKLHIFDKQQIRMRGDE